jgi:Skp family chaperone for outer membrane proteins
MIRSQNSLLLLSFIAIISISSFSQTAAGAANPAVSTTTNAAAAAPSRIAFVNLQEVVVSCNEGKQESAALQQRFAAKQNALKAQDDELKKLKDDYQAQEAKLNEQERSSRLKVIQDKQKAFDRSYGDFQSEGQEAQQEAMNRIVKKLLPVLEKYVTSNGYTAAFDLSNPQTPVIWVNQESVITKQVVEAYNAQSTAVPTPAKKP